MTYVNPVAAFARVIESGTLVNLMFPFADSLPPISYGDDLASMMAAEKGMQAVTAAMIAEPEMSVYDFFYIFDAAAHEYGMEPWVGCDGVDPSIDGKSVDIWTVSGRCLSNRDPETRVFVKKADLVPVVIARAQRLKAA